jgi:hypothetical protein
MYGKKFVLEASEGLLATMEFAFATCLSCNKKNSPLQTDSPHD